MLWYNKVVIPFPKNLIYFLGKKMHYQKAVSA